MNQSSPSDDTKNDLSWPLTFSSFAFDARCYNTLVCSILFHGHQHALDREIDGPSGEPNSPDWKERWTAGFIIPEDRMPPGPVEVKWTSLDGSAHAAEIDLIGEVFPNRIILHDVARQDVWEFWESDSLGHVPEILLEVNDRAIRVYMSTYIMTRQFEGQGEAARRIARSKLSMVWSKTY